MSEILGIDVSHHQGKIDWAKVAKSGKKFTIMKCQYEAQSHRIDECFEYNYSESGKNGLARGVYIYIARASMADPKADAESLLKHLNGRKLEYGIWLDLEDKTVDVKGKQYIRDLAYQYANIFKQAGYYVGIYCNKDWYTRLIHDDLKRDFDFWIARYPSVDNGYYNTLSALKPIYNGVVAWQYSSKGKVDGIQGNVDLNVDYDGIINLSTPKVNVSYPKPTRTLKRGDKGDDVKWLQSKLNEHSASLVIDGSFGRKTEEAVKKFQTECFVNGVVDTNTLEKL